MDFADLQDQARTVRARYAEFETARYGRSWTTEEIMIGFVGDVGDLAKLVQGEAGFTATMNDLTRRLDERSAP